MIISDLDVRSIMKQGPPWLLVRKSLFICESMAWTYECRQLSLNGRNISRGGKVSLKRLRKGVCRKELRRIDRSTCAPFYAAEVKKKNKIARIY